MAVFSAFSRRLFVPNEAKNTLRDIVKTGLDLLLILITEVFLPFLFSLLDMIMCLVDWFAYAGWGEQLQCIQQSCFSPTPTWWPTRSTSSPPSRR